LFIHVSGKLTTPIMTSFLLYAGRHKVLCGVLQPFMPGSPTSWNMDIWSSLSRCAQDVAVQMTMQQLVDGRLVVQSVFFSCLPNKQLAL